MAESGDFIEQGPLQDRDLLLRMSLYFDAIEQRLRQGQGWFIFNASPGRSNRISTLIERRLTEHEQALSAFVTGWPDFPLSAYVNEVGLPELTPAEPDAFAGE